jgi:hypothetical protein
VCLRLQAPIERRPDVVVLGVQSRQPFEQSSALECWLRVSGQRHEESEMPSAGGLHFAGLDQSITCVVPDRFEQVIPRGLCAVLNLHQRTIDQSGEKVEHPFLADVVIRAHALH